MFNQYDGFLSDEFFELLTEIYDGLSTAQIVEFLLGEGQ